jgi:hypothetical protein
MVRNSFPLLERDFFWACLSPKHFPTQKDRAFRSNLFCQRFFPSKKRISTAIAHATGILKVNFGIIERNFIHQKS